MRIKFSKNDVIKLLSGKRILNIFNFRSHKTLKPRSKFILKNLFFVQKLNNRKLGFNTPLTIMHQIINF